MEFLFKLKASVNQEGNTSIVPSAETLKKVALDEIGKYFREVKKNNA